FRASMLAASNPPLCHDLLNQAIAADPVSAKYHRALAEEDAATGDVPNALTQYDQAVRRDPNNMNLRIEYADLLRKSGRDAEARRQYEAALAINSALPPTEIQRLPEAKAAQIGKALESLR
ncbi:MAG TPA: tetratricopeptide repeat protein, partial [Tepidisphaeraceae bacterium]|nr:tetratricopeptide repeat protein [Tepidisphaeraceae bacterium]